MPIVTLTTDFGHSDYYVGAMKGAILRVAPTAQLIDISHQIPPQDILAAAFTLRHAACEFPPGTTHLAVVDPGVGTQRRPLAFKADDQTWVGPDNGLFSFILDRAEGPIHEIDREDLCAPQQSSTFHGRDIFAPIAAHLCDGLDLSEIGPAIPNPIRLNEIAPRKSPDQIEGQIIHVDRFGNLVSNITASDIEPWESALRIRFGPHSLSKIKKAYADVATEEPLALIGSANFLEISVNGGNAAQRFGLDRRAPIIIEKIP